MMRSAGSTGLLTIAALASLAAGCGARALKTDMTGGPGNIGGTSTGTGGSPFNPTRDADVLFMIDNSSEVLLEQQNLIRNFPAFVSALSAAPGGLPNLHIAVVTSDLGAGDGSIAGCAAEGPDAGDGGRFQAIPRGSCTATNLNAGARFISTDFGLGNYTGRLEDVFACIAAVGETGCGFEHQLAAISRALGADGQPAPPDNQDFLRNQAFLLVVLLTNEDDCSAPFGTGFYDTKTDTTLASYLGPIQNYRCNEFGHLCNGQKPPRYAPTGSVDDVVTLDGCTSAEGFGLLTPVGSFVQQLRSLKAYPDDQILVAAIASPPTPYVVHWRNPSTADPGGPWPEMSHACTTPSAVFADPAVRITQWANDFGAGGKTYTVCNDDFGPTMQAIGHDLAQRIPEPVNMP